MYCHQLCTVALSFLPYTTGKQQLEGEMPKIRNFHFINCSQRDNQSAVADFRRLGTMYRVFFVRGDWRSDYLSAHETFKKANFFVKSDYYESSKKSVS